jgi:hypothetical protein
MDIISNKDYHGYDFKALIAISSIKLYLRFRILAYCSLYFFRYLIFEYHHVPQANSCRCTNHHRNDEHLLVSCIPSENWISNIEYRTSDIGYRFRSTSINSFVHWTICGAMCESRPDHIMITISFMEYDLGFLWVAMIRFRTRGFIWYSTRAWHGMTWHDMASHGMASRAMGIPIIKY